MISCSFILCGCAVVFKFGWYKILKDKDKEKQGEHGGIGTPATRSAIIKNLFERGYLAEKGKSIVSTDRGKALYDLLDDKIRYPDMTAVWEEQQQNIKGEQDVYAFIEQMQNTTIAPTVNALKANYTKPTPKEKPSSPCPECGRAMYQKSGKFGLFWGCSGWNDKENPCNHMMNDKNGKPVPKEPKPAQNLSEFDCKKCGKKLILRQGTSKAGKSYSFFGCSGFPKCKQNYDEVNGVPKYD